MKPTIKCRQGFPLIDDELNNLGGQVLNYQVLIIDDNAQLTFEAPRPQGGTSRQGNDQTWLRPPCGTRPRSRPDPHFPRPQARLTPGVSPPSNTEKTDERFPIHDLILVRFTDRDLAIVIWSAIRRCSCCRRWVCGAFGCAASQVQQARPERRACRGETHRVWSKRPQCRLGVEFASGPLAAG